MKILWKTYIYIYHFLTFSELPDKYIINKFQLKKKGLERKKEREWWHRVSLLIALHGSTNVNANEDYLETSTIAKNKIENL